jgi:NAD(P)-dependent dehydrogenase (short-subunit alcohol dehydrogenase family)
VSCCTAAVEQRSTSWISQDTPRLFSEALAIETADTGIKVFAIHPGTVQTPMNAYVHDSPVVAGQAPQIQQWFRTLYAEGKDHPIEQSVRLVMQIAAGEADSLSGCYLSVDDDIAALARHYVDEPIPDQRKLRLVR